MQRRVYVSLWETEQLLLVQDGSLMYAMGFVDGRGEAFMNKGALTKYWWGLFLPTPLVVASLLPPCLETHFHDSQPTYAK